MDFPKYLREELIPAIASSGKFDKDIPGDGDLIVQELRVKPVGGLGEDHWASSTFMVEVDFRRNTRTESINLVVKFVSPGDGFIEFSLVDEMGKNEARMYNSILPYFDEMWTRNFGEDPAIYPRCYRAQLTDPVLIVMENLGSSGFRLSTDRTFLDKHHLFVTIKKVALFHALSYAAKALDSKNFLPLAHLLRETHYVPEKQQAQGELLKNTVTRGLNGLENEAFSTGGKAIFEKIKARLADPFSIMAEAANSQRLPEADALSVVTHGDFLRNNMLFKYDETGKPVDVRFFDFQTSRYTTPAFDLALYIFMNTTREVRKECWDDIFKTYHDTLVSTVKLLGASEKDAPTLNAIKSDFARNGLSGYCICSFFLPIMMVPPDAQRFEDSKAAGATEEHAKNINQLAGEEGTSKLNDIIRDLVQLNEQLK